ncbi:hypothetical protein GCM10009785_13980 [Brooklawnia cerclae]|uniref:Transcriptional regulator with XRE-family HTH domain n=1 Tax=Brooklawnia cerclae TaxID=349934 RepID=A0ABX0SI10_9ACTN|nr:helix-turn-helix transcriptional regulator [Brooklawnia cerclae]NIH58032.1 transcriptional regulator with XRE-family HTH domain [Brooklawnia cerclae]
MPTEAGKRAARLAVRRAMAGETQQAFAERAGVDQTTLGTFLNGSRWPRSSTLTKIEDALSLTPGTLAAFGEEVLPAPDDGPERTEASKLTDDQLLTELTYRVARLRRRVEELEEPAGRELARERERLEFLRTLDADDREGQDIGEEWTALNWLADERGWGPEDASNYELLCRRLDALIYQRRAERERGSAPRPTPLRQSSGQYRMRPASQAAHRGSKMKSRITSAQDAAGEENQDPGATDPA